MKRGEYLAEKRLQSGLSEKQLAEKLGAAEEEVRQWEAGAFPDAKYLLPLSEILGADTEEILRNCSQDAPEAFSRQKGAEEGSAAENAARDASGSDGKESAGEPAPKRPPAAKKQTESYYERLHKKIRYSDDPDSRYYRESRFCNGFSPSERVFGYIACILCVILCIFGTVWHLVEKHSEDAFSSQTYASCPADAAAGEGAARSAVKSAASAEINAEAAI